MHAAFAVGHLSARQLAFPLSALLFSLTAPHLPYHFSCLVCNLKELIRIHNVHTSTPGAGPRRLSQGFLSGLAWIFEKSSSLNRLELDGNPESKNARAT